MNLNTITKTGISRLANGGVTSDTIDEINTEMKITRRVPNLIESQPPGS